VARPADDSWLDGDAGRLVRPYTVSNGRTSAKISLDLLSMVMSTGGVPVSRLEPDHAQALAICAQPASVAEIAARLRLPAMVTKVLVSDLLECGAVTTRQPHAITGPGDRIILERVLDALQQRL
jgi:Protein of unknown function (DUF742)